MRPPRRATSEILFALSLATACSDGAEPIRAGGPDAARAFADARAAAPDAAFVRDADPRDADPPDVGRADAHPGDADAPDVAPGDAARLDAGDPDGSGVRFDAGDPPRCTGTISGPFAGSFACVVRAGYDASMDAFAISIFPASLPLGVVQLSMGLAIPGRPRVGRYSGSAELVVFDAQLVTGAGWQSASSALVPPTGDASLDLTGFTPTGGRPPLVEHDVTGRVTFRVQGNAGTADITVDLL